MEYICIVYLFGVINIDTLLSRFDQTILDGLTKDRARTVFFYVVLA